jgi:hypothetical protein
LGGAPTGASQAASGGAQRRPIRRISVLVGIALVAFGALLTTRASAAIYWANFSNRSSIGRANLDGSNANPHFITGANQPFAVAVDAAHIYWANGSSIGRANIDGSGVNQNFITGVSRGGYGLGLDGKHIYWANSGANAIGRANIDGTGVDQNFIYVSDGIFVNGVTVAGPYIYWTNGVGIGRATLDGNNVNEQFIQNNDNPLGLAVDAAHIYWASGCQGECGGHSIGRANLDGTGSTTQFITGLHYPAGIGIDGAHIYWSEGQNIGRANLEGSGVNRQLISLPPGNTPYGIAIDSRPAPRVCLVPRLKGEKLREAKRTLTNSGCELGEVNGPRSGKVRKQQPKPGTVLPFGSKVSVTTR